MAKLSILTRYLKEAVDPALDFEIGRAVKLCSESTRGSRKVLTVLSSIREEGARRFRQQTVTISKPPGARRWRLDGVGGGRCAR